MLVLISPAKTLDFESPLKLRKHSRPRFLEQSAHLIEKLRPLKPAQVSNLMKISAKLGELNYGRYQSWQIEHRLHAGGKTSASGAALRQAVLAFQGDVYQGLQAADFNPAELNYAQQHLRILSGLYGLLRPLDLIQAYRLEMGTRLSNGHGKDLYDFWNHQLADQIQADAQWAKTGTIINLASVEYNKAARLDELRKSGLEVISPVFKDYSNGQYKIVSFFAKQARGMLARFIIKNRLKDPGVLYDFNAAGYKYTARESTPEAPVFKRKQT